MERVLVRELGRVGKGGKFEQDACGIGWKSSGVLDVI